MMENAWFYYFSSLAQTVAAASALLVAIAVIRLQSLSNSLNEIQRLLAEIFYDIGQIDKYRKASTHFLNDDWIKYFAAVKALKDECRLSFPHKGTYAQSGEYADILIQQGIGYESRISKLHRSLVKAFFGTVVFAGGAILVLPIARNAICPSLLMWSWLGTGAFLLILLACYLCLVQELRRQK